MQWLESKGYDRNVDPEKVSDATRPKLKLFPKIAGALADKYPSIFGPADEASQKVWDVLVEKAKADFKLDNPKVLEEAHRRIEKGRESEDDRFPWEKEEQAEEWGEEQEAPPVTRERRRDQLRETFELTEEQAEGVMAIIEATGLPLDWFDVAAPGQKPPLDSLKQIVEAAKYLHERGEKFQTKSGFAKAWRQAIRKVSELFPAFTKTGRVSEKNLNRAVKAAMKDVGPYFEKNPTHAEYYSREARKERAAISQIFPELGKDDVAWVLYKMVTGIASNSTRLSENTTEAIDAWANYRKAGRFGVSIIRGKRNAARLGETEFMLHGGPVRATKALHYSVLNSLLDRFGNEAAVVEWLLKEVPAKDIRHSVRTEGFGLSAMSGKDHGKVMRSVEDATGQRKTAPRIMAFGPKVGPYAMNLLGVSGYTTGDVWESRFWRSYFKGIPESTGLEEDTKTRSLFIAASRRMAEEMGLSPSAAQAVRWYFTLSQARRAGYSKAGTDATIAEYTQRELARRKADVARVAKARTKRKDAERRRGGKGSARDRIRAILGPAIFGEAVEPSTLQQDQQIGDKILGWTHFAESGKALIGAFENPNVSTAIHEVFHVLRRLILNRDVPAAERVGITDADIKLLEKWAGVKDGKWTRRAEEKVARAFERYLHDGKVPAGAPAGLKDLFAKFAEWLGEIYRKLVGSPINIKISPEVRGVFDKLMQRGQPPAAGEVKAEPSTLFQVVHKHAESIAAKTAIARKAPSVPAKHLIKKGLIRGRTLDYGSGRGADAEATGAEQYDPKYAPQEPEGTFDTVYSNYVLNVIENPQERREVLENIHALLNPGGTAYITVRGDKKYLEGKTKAGTWQGFVELQLPVERRAAGKYTMYRATKEELGEYLREPDTLFQAEPEPPEGYELTSIKKDVVNELREMEGLPELEGSTPETIEGWAETARATLAADPMAARRLYEGSGRSGSLKGPRQAGRRAHRCYCRPKNHDGIRGAAFAG
jgi:hypothetical protein